MKTRLSLAVIGLLLSLQVSAAVGLTPAVHRRLGDIREQMAEGEHQQGLRRLRQLLSEAKGDRYSEAVIRQHLGYGYLDTGDLAAAQRELDAALRASALPAEVNRRLLRLLAQVAAQRERPQQALGYLREWLRDISAPTPKDQVLAARIHYAAGNPKQAIGYLEQAIAAVEQPAESWQRSLLGMYMETKRHTKARRLLRRLIQRYPAEPDYWRNLAHLESARGKPRRALAVLAGAYRQGLLEERELSAFARLHATAGIPEKAARLLREWRRSGKLAGTQRQLADEAELWLMAREREPAKQLLRTLADSHRSGQAAYRLGCLLFEEGQWGESSKILAQSLTQGGFKQRDQARLLLGIAALKAGDATLAEDALKQALGDPDTRKQAAPWLAALDAEARPSAHPTVR